MPKTITMPKKVNATRERLIQAGVTAIHAFGYNAAGVQEITASAGAPKGTFYNHFPTKEAFAAEVLDHYFSRHIDEELCVFLDEGISPLRRVRRYFMAMSKMMTDGRFERGCLLGNLSLEIADHSDMLRERLVVHTTRWCETAAQCIRQGQKLGEIRDDVPAEDLAELLFYGWQGALCRMRVDKNGRSLKHFRRYIVDLFLPTKPLDRTA